MAIPGRKPKPPALKIVQGIVGRGGDPSVTTERWIETRSEAPHVTEMKSAAEYLEEAPLVSLRRRPRKP